MLLDELVGIVDKCCPQNVNVHIEALKTMATITKDTEGTFVNYFPIEQLSVDPATRIIEMFQFQSCWEESQLMDYMQHQILSDQEKIIKRYTLATASKGGTTYKLKPGILL